MISVGRNVVRLSFFAKLALLVSWGTIISLAAPRSKADPKQEAFENLFGEAAQLDPKMIAEVKKLPPKQKLLVDIDGDGKSDEAWFIDDSYRHTIRPILIKVIDEDGDLDTQGPDRDSDLYIVDWYADGKVDYALDYVDTDGDGDMDQWGFFWWKGPDIYFGQQVLAVVWKLDMGDHNIGWWDVNWRYYQDICQYRCGLFGDAWSASFRLPSGAKVWRSVFENPFAFYDPDRDGASEVVVRFSGAMEGPGSLRYSFDADRDAWGRRVYDYDFSITALAKGAQAKAGEALPSGRFKLPENVTISLSIRGIPTERTLSWEKAQQFVRNGPWVKACLTWDEINANTEWNVDRDPHERWEGVIVQGSDKFPQIGGPPCGKRNKRNEVVENPAKPLQLYYDSTDHRLHLLGRGPAVGWLWVDWNLDGSTDAVYNYFDDNGDGVFDRREIDLNADGKAEFLWSMQGSTGRRIPLDYEALSSFYVRVLQEVLSESQIFIRVAKAALGSRLIGPDPVEAFFLTKISAWHPETKLGQRVRSTPAGARYYVDLLRDRLFYRLKQAFGREKVWPHIEKEYARGRYREAARLLGRNLPIEVRPRPPESFRWYTRRLSIKIDNKGGPRRENWPVVLRIRDLRRTAKDFNPQNCALVAPKPWIDWLEIPHQVDQIDPMVGPELSFLVDLPENGEATYYLYWLPTGKAEKRFERRTGAARWESNVGWESTYVAYRSYTGHFDFFGKQQYTFDKQADPRYTYGRKVDWLIYPLKEGINYHKESEWGMDALLIGDSAGVGGLTLYLGGKDYPLYGAAEDRNLAFSQRVLFQGPIRSAVEININGISPDTPHASLRLVCVIYAEREESEIRAEMNPALQGALLAPGVTRLVRERVFFDEKLGCFGSWGWQDDEIGNVGLGIIVPPERLHGFIECPLERRVCCSIGGKKLRYWIIARWAKGYRFSIAPTIQNWKRDLTELAWKLHNSPQISLSPPEKVLPVRPKRVILFLIDGLHWQAPERLGLSNFQALVERGASFAQAWTVPPAHPKSGEWAQIHNCSLPNPVMLAGTVFLSKDHKMVQHVFGPETAHVNNCPGAYRTLNRGFTYIHAKTASDRWAIDQAIKLLREEPVSFLRIHLQDTGIAGYNCRIAEEGKPFRKNIWGLGSPYVEKAKEADRLLGEFVNALKDLGLYQDTLLIVASDHGQAKEGWHPPDEPESAITPLVFVGPGIKAGERFPYAEHIDIVPTICYIMGKKLPNKNGGCGRVLTEILVGGKPVGRARPQYLKALNETLREYKVLVGLSANAAKTNTHVAEALRKAQEEILDTEKFLRWKEAGGLAELIEHNRRVMKRLREALSVLKKQSVK